VDVVTFLELDRMPRSRSMLMSGWGGVPRETSEVFRPERISQAREVVAGAGPATLIARGLGRSYGDAAVNAGGGVLLDTRLDRMLSFDAASGILECEGGTSIAEILEVFLPRGFFPAVTPGTKYVTVGGAIAADVHGKNHHCDGSIGEFVESFDLLAASGEVLRCSREENSEAFWATLGGMGLTGVILSARIKLRKIESAYVTVDYRKTASFDEALAAFAEGDSGYQYSMAWIDCLAGGASLGRSVVMRGNHAMPAELPEHLRPSPLDSKTKRKKNVPFQMPSFLLSPLTVKVFNRFFYGRHSDKRAVVDYDSFFYPLDSVLNWNRVYGKRGFFQYQAVFPVSQAGLGLRELLEKLSASKRASFLAVLKSMGKESGGLLSFPFPGQTIALDLPNKGPDTAEFLRGLDEIVLKHGGRVYLAKDACTSPQTFRAMYPKMDRFNAIKARLDPQGRFSSSQSRRLHIGEGI
jgi:decaprenylphospho-beta-D-ribofuranose 2-oxidase